MKNVCKNCGKEINSTDANINHCEACNSFKKSNEQSLNSPNEQDHSQPEKITPRYKLSVVKGDLFNTIKRITRTRDLLNFSNSILWPDLNFTEEQSIRLQKRIAEHFRDSRDIDQTFRELVERTVLAKRWVDEVDYRTLLSPVDWFNINRIDGLYFTHGLYNKVLLQRNTIPSYQFGLTVISEAILKYCEQRNVLDIYSYREQFIKLNRMDLLQYYFNAVMHIQFINL